MEGWREGGREREGWIVSESGVCGVGREKLSKFQSCQKIQ